MEGPPRASSLRIAIACAIAGIGFGVHRCVLGRNPRSFALLIATTSFAGSHQTFSAGSHRAPSFFAAYCFCCSVSCCRLSLFYFFCGTPYFRAPQSGGFLLFSTLGTDMLVSDQMNSTTTMRKIISATKKTVRKSGNCAPLS